MFGNNKNKENTMSKSGASPAPNSMALNSLVTGTSVEGQITSDNDIRVDGFIKGSLNCKAKVIIGPSGKIEGNVTCVNAVIEGIFDGIINVAEILKITETAQVQGEVNTKKLQVDSGAVFNVTCSMGGNSAKSNKQAKVESLAKERVSA